MFTTSQEFLDLGAGDYEEHAILLTNLFNYIDKRQNNGLIRSYLVFGNGVPEGYSTYVLRRHVETNHIELWNSIKGEAYYFGRQKVRGNVGCCSID